MTLREAKAAMLDSLKGREGFGGIGLGKDKIIVLWRTEPVPNMMPFEGWPVEVVFSGEPKAL